MRDKTICMQYRALDAQLARCDDRLSGSGEAETEVFVPTAQNRAHAASELSQLKSQIDELPAPDPAFAFLKGHMNDFHDAMAARLDTKFTRPGSSLSGFAHLHDVLRRVDCRDEHVRVKKLMRKLENARELYSATDALLDGLSPDALLEVISACKSNAALYAAHSARADEHFPELSGGEARYLSDCLLDFSTLNASLKKRAQALVESSGIPAETTDDSVIKMTRDEYSALLRDRHGVELDELLEWHETEIEKTRAAALEIASRLNIPEKNARTMGEVNAILLKYAGPAETPDEMFKRGRGYVVRAAAAARGYVRLPDETCNVGTVPEILKFSYPWGGYGGGCRRRRPPVGEMFLNEHNFTAVTDGWMKMMAIHEAYPGHHVQFVRALLDPIPETLKRGAKSTPLTEGAAHRSEEVFEFVFEEDPFYPLFVAYRRHHTAVRVKADLMLRYFGNTIGDAVKLYMNEMDFDYHTARGQVKAQENMLGYFTTYYYGYKKIAQYERELGFDAKEYTELIFSGGRMSVQNLKLFLQLSAEQRQSVLHDFASLLQFGEDYSELPIKMD